MPAIDLRALLPWMLRAVAILCAAGSGWSFGRSVPSWEADKATDHFDLDVLGDDRVSGIGWGWGGWGWGFGIPYGHHPWGCLSLEAFGCAGCLGALAQLLSGSLSGAICLIAAVVATYYSWPWAAIAIDHHSWGMALFATPGLWLSLAGLVGGWTLAVTTDKGPVGPLD